MMIVLTMQKNFFKTDTDMLIGLKKINFNTSNIKNVWQIRIGNLFIGWRRKHYKCGNRYSKHTIQSEWRFEKYYWVFGRFSIIYG